MTARSNTSATVRIGTVSSVPDWRPQVVLVSHGYELIYERGFCNGVADAGVDCTLLGSDRTDVARLRPGVSVVNLRGSQAPQRSRLSKLLNLLRYHARLVLYVARRRPVVHVFGLIHPPVLVGVVEGYMFRWLAARYILTAHDLMPHDKHDAWHRWVFGLSYRLADCVVVHTEKMRSDIVAMHGVDRSRVVLMEHGSPDRLAITCLMRGSFARAMRSTRSSSATFCVLSSDAIGSIGAYSTRLPAGLLVVLTLTRRL